MGRLRDKTQPKTSRKNRRGERLRITRNPLSHNDSVMDLNIASVGISTTALVLAEPLDPAMKATTGQFALFPAVFKPFMGAAISSNVFSFVGKIRLKYLQFKFNLVGAQSNALVSADLFARVRIVGIFTRSPYLQTPNFNAISIDTHVDLRDAELLYDQTINLPSQAFDSSDYNVPACKTVQRTIYLNKLLEVFSTSGGVTWDTRQGNIRFYAVSDSSAVPHPSLSGSTRLIYSIVRD